MKKKTLLLATTNKGKIREVKAILKNLNLNITLPNKVIEDYQSFEVEENGKTFAENAAIKAQAYGKKSGLLTLADDSGLEIQALGGDPGVKSARFAQGNDQKRINKVLQLMRTVPDEKRSARFVACVAIFNPDNSQTRIFKGKTEGKILRRPEGLGGFGYDPIFYSTEINKSFGQASIKRKNQVSHRARALIKSGEFLKELARE